MTIELRDCRSTIYKAGLLTLYSLCGYVFMEWMFFATKPSFLTSYSLIERILSLFVAPLFFLPLVFLAFIVTVLVFIVVARVKKSQKLHILAVVPAGIITVLNVLLIDNFSNTVLDTSISHTRNHQPYVWLIVISIIWVSWCLWFSNKLRLTTSRTGMSGKLGFGILGVSVLSAIILIITAEDIKQFSTASSPTQQLPNIIFFAADGIQANHLSVYGYERITTPNLNAILDQSLVVYNAVANAGRTTGSTTSMFTGKYPTTNKVIFPPHVLRGRSALEHLPGILGSIGYRNIQESVRYYADGVDLNMRNSFNFSNGRTIHQDNAFLPP